MSLSRRRSSHVNDAPSSAYVASEMCTRVPLAMEMRPGTPCEAHFPAMPGASAVTFLLPPESELLDAPESSSESESCAEQDEGYHEDDDEACDAGPKVARFEYWLPNGECKVSYWLRRHI